MLRPHSLRHPKRLSHIIRQFKPTSSTSRRNNSTDIPKQHEEVHETSPKVDKLDNHLEGIARTLSQHRLISIRDLYQQYQNEAGNVIDRVVPYEERPHASKRADAQPSDLEGFDNLEGDGLVLVVHAQLDSTSSRLEKTTVCSGFVVNASVNNESQGDTIVTCAHTLEEITRHLRRTTHTNTKLPHTFSFIIPANGPPRPITRLLSSMPRSDVIVLEIHPNTPSPTTKRLRPLPLTPYPVHSGTRILTHLFGSPDPPPVNHSIARTRTLSPVLDNSAVETPIPWLSGHAWRRWGAGQMLGYRSYTGLEVEAGISSILPHILTSILPTSGSSGGPLINADTGCVVGMTSGRRMDNRVEGERGWGCSSEGIFEMFSLPGFMPAKR